MRCAPAFLRLTDGSRSALAQGVEIADAKPGTPAPASATIDAGVILRADSMSIRPRGSRHLVSIEFF